MQRCVHTSLPWSNFCFAVFDLIVSLTLVAVSRYELKPMDEMLVLCSDGVFEKPFGGVTEKVIAQARTFVTTYGFEQAPEWLCEKAVEDSCDDNVTAVFVRFCEIKPIPQPARRPFKKL